MIPSFSVGWRGPGHWDIHDGHQRIFCIRGVPGAYLIRDERAKEVCGPTREGFPTVESAMAWICATLMHEPERELCAALHLTLGASGEAAKKRGGDYA